MGVHPFLCLHLHWWHPVRGEEAVLERGTDLIHITTWTRKGEVCVQLKENALFPSSCNRPCRHLTCGLNSLPQLTSLPHSMKPSGNHQLQHLASSSSSSSSLVVALLHPGEHRAAAPRCDDSFSAFNYRGDWDVCLSSDESTDERQTPEWWRWRVQGSDLNPWKIQFLKNFDTVMICGLEFGKERGISPNIRNVLI